MRSPILRVGGGGDAKLRRDALQLQLPLRRVHRGFNRPRLLDLLGRLGGVRAGRGRSARERRAARPRDVRQFLLLVVVVRRRFAVRPTARALASSLRERRLVHVRLLRVSIREVLGARPSRVVSLDDEVAEADEDGDHLAAVRLLELARGERGGLEVALLELGEDVGTRGVGVVELRGGLELAPGELQEVRGEGGEVMELLPAVARGGGEVRARQRRPRRALRREEVALVVEQLELLHQKLHLNLGLARELQRAPRGGVVLVPHPRRVDVDRDVPLRRSRARRGWGRVAPLETSPREGRNLEPPSLGS